MTKARDLANLISSGNIFSDGAVAASEVTGLASSATIDTTNAGNITSGTLSAARLPAFSGDATSSAGTSQLTLASSGVVAGTYTKFSVDAKGRVTSGTTLLSADLPTYTGTLTSSQVTDALGFTPYNSTNPSGYISGNQNITFSGDASGSGATSVTLTLANSGVVAGTYGSSTAVPVVTVDSKGRVTGVSTSAISGSLTFTGDVTGSGTTGSSTALTLANSGVTSGTYTKITVDAKGRATSGTTLSASDIPSLDASKITSGVIDAARLPSYVDDVLEYANLASFPSPSGETGKIYLALDTNKAYRWSGSAYVYITSGAVDSVAGKTGVVTLTNSDVGLGNVENKSSATIRGEITSSNVTTALGFTPYNSTNPSGYITSSALSPYLTTATASSTYLPLAGGTLTGSTEVSGSSNLRYIGFNFYSALKWNFAIDGSTDADKLLVRKGTTTYASWDTAGQFNNTAAIMQNGSQVLHAGNYTSYAPYIQYTRFDGDLNTLGVSQASSGIYSIGGSYTNGPGSALYGTLMTFWNVDISTQFWTSYNGNAYWRKSIGGTYTGSTWRTFLDSSNYSSYALPLTGGTVSGAVTINAGSGYPLSLSSSSRYQLQIRNTAASAQTYGWWLAHDSGGNLVFHADSAGDRASLTNGGTFNATNITSNGNQTLHAGNYTSYSPSLTGSGASGTWGINVTGTASMLNQYSIASFIWTGSQVLYYWTRIGTMPAEGKIIFNIESKTDANYVPYVQARLSVSSWNGTSLSAKLDCLTSYDLGIYVAIDNSNNVWIKSDAVWNSYLVYRVDQNDGVTVYTSGQTQQTTQPANSVVITPGYSVRGTQGSIASASPGASSPHTLSGLNTIGAITQAGSQVLHAGNYSGYALPLSGGMLSGNIGQQRGAIHYFERSSGTNVGGIGWHTDDYFYVAGHPSVGPQAGNAVRVYGFGGDLLLGNQTHGDVLRITGGSANINGNQILHAGNYSSYALPLSGGTISGSVTATDSFIARNILRVQNGTADWDSIDLDAGGATHSINARGAETGLSFQFDGTERLFLSNGGNLTASGNVTAYSDERLKKDWADLADNFVEQLAQVKCGTYTRTDADIRQVGVSAQSLQQVMPEAVLVSNDDQQTLSVAYGNAALAACVELAKELVKLREELALLKQQK